MKTGLIKTMSIKQLAPGFTLIELVVVIAIVSILAAVGAPIYSATITSMRTKGEIDALASDLNYTRSVAIKLGQDVSICPTAGGCATNNWISGWTVFQGTLTTPVTTANTKKIQGDMSSSTTDTLVSAGGLTGGISFNRNGFTYAGGQITLHTTPDNAAVRKCLNFSAVTGSIGTWVLQTGTSCP